MIKLLPIRLKTEEKKEFESALKSLEPFFNRRGQSTDVLKPAIEGFINAAKQGRSIEFIEHIKSWQ